ncbi:MAG: hypothetical protein IPP71_21025 [Bacteroidetes bacterium]|nr:hypothetical protein [Bacteroidota bacterium]
MFNCCCANSNNIVITVTAPTSASISISANPATPICEQDNIIFSAVATNGGTNPIYQWQVNGAFTGATGPTYAIASLSDGDQVSAVLTSSLTCLTTGTANSNVITVAVNPILPVSSLISISPSNQFCTGTLVTFTGTVVNGGTNPSYQWQVNGANAGGNSNTFSASTLNDGDRIRVIVTSNLNCVSPVTAASNIIIVSVLPLTNPSVSITANTAGTVCPGNAYCFYCSSVGWWK